VGFARTTFREYFRHRQWTIGLVRAPIHRFLEKGFRPDVEWIRVPSREEYLADPFGMVRDGRLSILCERYDRRTGKGTLIAFDWPAVGQEPNPGVALPVDHHASYPFLLEWEGRVFCVPETYGAGEIRLYEATSFPHGWTQVATLVPGFPGVDTSMFRFEDRWWLCSTHADAPDRRLFIWYADRPEGPWTPHARSPVKDDLSSARSAGTPFVWGGTLHRPAQDCSKTYGGRVMINAVDRLTPEEFEEHVAAVVNPDPHGPRPLGLHTLSAVGEMTLIDGFRDVFSWSAFRKRLGMGFLGRLLRGS
jgi:hypothetical protein